MRVAARAIDHRAGDAALVRDPRQDVAPHGRILAAAVVQHHHAPRPHIVDVVTNRAGGIARGAIQDREGAAGQAEAWIERLDVQALPGDAESIERVADRRRIELRGALHIGVVRVFRHVRYRFSIVS